MMMVMMTIGIHPYCF